MIIIGRPESSHKALGIGVVERHKLSSNIGKTTDLDVMPTDMLIDCAVLLFGHRHGSSERPAL